MNIEANNLDKIMTKQGRKTRWLAEQIGLTPQAVSHYRTGKRKVRLAAARLIAEKLNVKVEDLTQINKP